MSELREYRRILLDGNAVDVRRDGETLVAGDGRTVAIADATHLPPVTPSKIICVHLNYSSRVEEMLTTLPPAPTYFHKPVSALTAHESAVVRPEGCKWLNYEGEIAIVIGRTARNISPEAGGGLHPRLLRRQRLRPARLPRHRLRLDAASQGRRHAVPHRTRHRRGLGLPRQADPHDRQR